MRDNWQIALKERITKEFVKKPEEWVDLNISTSGLLNLTVVSDYFAEQPFVERKKKLSDILSTTDAPIRPGFLSLYTLQEAKSLQLTRPIAAEYAKVKTWQDLARWAANPQNESALRHRDRSQHRPRTVTFYSYKGGVGRTTALTHVAWILAMRGRKVVAIDLDLEAPGLSTAFNLMVAPKYGIVDYFYERAYLPQGIKPDISVAQIFGEVNIPNATGRLFVVPAGSLSLDYIAKVDDLHATTILGNGEGLWTTFEHEIFEQIKPDVLLVDSRTGLNQWGALSLLQAADEVIVFLFPNEQNRRGVDLVIESLQSLKDLSISFVFTPVPDTTQAGLTKVKEIFSTLQHRMSNLDNSGSTEELEHNPEDHEQLDLIDSQADEQDADSVLIVPYLPSIATADSYPVTALLDYYARIANIIDEETDELQRTEVLARTDQRWDIIDSLKFPEVNAADPKQNLGLLFQKTTDFERFLDNTTCLVRGRKGTGKTALYWLLLKHFDVARKLAHGRLDDVTCFSGHGSFHESRPSRDEFRAIHDKLKEKQGSWEAFWRVYLLLRALQADLFKFPSGQKGKKFQQVKEILQEILSNEWSYEHTTALIVLSTESELILLVKDALNLLDDRVKEKSSLVWFLYDDLDEDFPQRNEVRKEALTGLFRFIQSCDARRIEAIRFKVFLREDIWQRLIFDNKSHFNGRELLLQWTRIDFLRLALRQAVQSSKFKELVSRFSPVESVDQADEETINRALELLWGSRRRRGSNAKYVSRWVYERLTDSGKTTFPRSLSILLEGAKSQELSYKGNSSIQDPTDRLLRGKSLEEGLKKASKERCDAIKEEYPDLVTFLDNLKGVTALAPAEEIERLWTESAQEVISSFEDFVEFISEIGVVEWRTKDQRYRFADIYVHGFDMSRTGTI